jgi:hypothetical protein
MNFSDDSLRILAERLGWSWAEGPERLRDRLESSLVPLIRCAIRTGTGLRPLVQWVRGQLPPAGAGDATRAAPEMARRLSSAILHQLQRRRAGAETVVGA